jgi:aldehyde dehydrogenase (NAD+)
MSIEILNPLRLGKSNSGTWCGTSVFAAKERIESISPVDGKKIATVSVTKQSDYEKIIKQAQVAQFHWRAIPAPKRGEIVRQIADELRKNKTALGKLVSYEMGKSLQEGYGEVQEMIDICDFAVGMSRQLYGLTMHSERPNHRMYEQWHPLGIVGVISAFNFPVAVWAWNAALAWICGNVVIWKASEKTPLCSVACQQIVNRVFTKNKLPDGISSIITGNYAVGEWMTTDKRIALISATGSTRMGKQVGMKVAERFGKSILELGGNNAIIISHTADLKLVLPAIIFGAIGTAGQRCTTTRRLIIHESIYDEVKEVLKKAYSQLNIGNPLDEKNHIGPLIDAKAVEAFLYAMRQVKKQGGKIFVPGKKLEGKSYNSGCYVSPCIAEVENHYDIVQHETFAPILYIMKYKTMEEAIAMQNDVPQGLSSSIMTESLRESELFLSSSGSDCGIANVNIGTSGAEIGGAFGGEKETGGGRESGSDAWKAYMRRQTNTISYSKTLTLAQGIKFDF